MAHFGASVKAKPTHQNIIRLAPPLVITEEQIDRAVEIFAEALRELVCVMPFRCPLLLGCARD